MSRVIVTGGAGFIGSHLTERLLDEGHQVIVLDDCSTGRKDNLGHLISHQGLRFVQCDISDLSKIEPLFEDIRDVYHLAGLADIVPSIQAPIRYHQANVNGTVAVLEASRRAGVSSFIYAASSSCYGIPDQYPTPETATIRPMYPYALTKWLGEQYVMHWSKVYGLPVVSLRLFNVYGPRSRTSGTYGAVFGVFLAQKLAGKPFTVVGDGNQSRDFTFVKDVVQAFVSAAKSNLTGEVFNVGSGKTYSINRLVELLRGEVVHLPRRPGEPDCTFADVRKIRKVLGWEAQTSFEQGVATMLANIEYWKAAPVWEAASIFEATIDWFRYLGRT
jgi:UDP-glucose 4-epimerase